jgi:uncharacterized protein HemY
LFKLTQQPKEKENVPKVSEEYNKPPSNEAFKNASSTVNRAPYSLAEELSKLAELKNQGIISDDEFVQLKQDAIRKSLRKSS